MNDILPLVSLASFVFIILVMVRASMHKAFDIHEFQGFVADYEVLPESLVKPVSYAIVAVEIGAVVLMLVPTLREFGLMLTIVLLSIYALSMGVNLVRGKTSIECGCGGTPQPLSYTLILRNIVLIVFALLPLSGLPEEFAFMETLLAMAAGVFLWVFYQFFEQTNANMIFIKTKQL
ncbi:MauE/DoxX family redox-associated membrane protein [Thiomicrorhabdus sp. ZW0627]|uniref:MauE/DoxX family redox-associated membrane protein n=1 Tax=Thiomicrorhabdus sp. ZW0627 TaxID=3039774 RepID=UPI0024371D7F|nr:MauE/DoxX family redox-associated membrane protein [Thiomicrorhabdus sp. ZW0627]MDG6774451.1 MauE/DoxX family redox-associated membrane protein [Thiomicrorhabdus sp. ZW0627]